ncbi:hypothetical protein [Actinoplanes philippinensis]|uniref:hypothetical protein n=1 Tax=Actinoplanes philippinensis TaxID=35752 RepID=UPI0033D8A530
MSCSCVGERSQGQRRSRARGPGETKSLVVDALGLDLPADAEFVIDDEDDDESPWDPLLGVWTIERLVRHGQPSALDPHRTAHGDRPHREQLSRLSDDPAVDWPHDEPETPHYRDRGDTPNGTFAGSGAGWIYADAPGLDGHLVRLELHDEPPPAGQPQFDEALETPYRSSSGTISLASVTSGPGDQVDLDLGDAEWFRVRIALRREDLGERPGFHPGFRSHWLVQFWPDTAVAAPVWLARSETVSSALLAQDLEAILRWTLQLPLQTSIPDLAERLLVSEADVRDGLTTAEQSGLLHDEGKEPLRLTLGPATGS